MNPDIFPSSQAWPYLGTLERVGLALAIGLFVGLERERRGKEAGVRTFALVATAGCMGGLLGDPYAYIILGLLLPLIVFLNIHSLRKDSDTEMTTSIALLLTALSGVLTGKGHTFTPVAVGLLTSGLLAWKQPLSGFSVGITEAELRSAILLGILTFVVLPVLPRHSVDPWGLFEPRAVWITVILIAAIGFGNYALLKLYGSKGVGWASFLAGLVNSTVAVTELANRTAASSELRPLVYRGTLLATGAMLVRNAILLAILSPDALLFAGPPMALMLATCLVLAFLHRPKNTDPGPTPKIELSSPVSLPQAFKFATLFLFLSVMGTLAQRGMGSAGFYAVSAAGGLVSSASSVASAGQLVAHGKLTSQTGGVGAAIATIMSAAISIPLVWRLIPDRAVIRSVTLAVAAVATLGLVGVIGAPSTVNWLRANTHTSAKPRSLP